MTFRVGLTGGIGSGKSAVGRLFEEKGIVVVDTDAIAHELTAPGGAAMAAIRAEFGPGVVAADGALDRAAMRARVFADPAARQRLEAILHPMIRDETERRAARADSPYVILMIPLLVESGGYRERVNRVLVVDCPVETQIARVMARNGLSRTEVERIIAAQASREARREAADDLIDNSGELAALGPRVDQLHGNYLKSLPSLG